MRPDGVGEEAAVERTGACRKLRQRSSLINSPGCRSAQSTAIQGRDPTLRRRTSVRLPLEVRPCGERNQQNGDDPQSRIAHSCFLGHGLHSKPEQTPARDSGVAAKGRVNIIDYCAAAMCQWEPALSDQFALFVGVIGVTSKRRERRIAVQSYSYAVPQSRQI